MDYDASLEPDESLGATLGRLRRAKGLSGRQLGDMVGMSQPKVSRLENNVGLPDPDDVARVARALNADEDTVLRLRERAARLHNRMTDWRQQPVGLARRQVDVGRVEEVARVFRVFQPTVIIGLLQTSDYARSVLTSYQRFTAGEDVGVSPALVAEAVSERLKRQVVLLNPNKTFHFVMAETVLSNRIGSPEEMPAQIRRLREVARQDNVTLGIVPSEKTWALPPYHGFELLDDRSVMVDLLNTGLTSHGDSDLRLYREVFDAFEEQAVLDIDSILDHYQNKYLELARPGKRS